MRPAVFLDRDGTLIEEVGYLDRVEQIALFPWSIDAVRLLNRAGLTTVVVTNQSAVARGYITEDLVRQVHGALDARLATGQARIDRYYFCPHHPQADVPAYRADCACRKPGPGMITQACAELGLDPARSWTIGDRLLDAAAGRAAGTRTIMVKTGLGAREAAGAAAAGAEPPDAMLNNLMEAVGWILRSSTSR